MATGTKVGQKSPYSGNTITKRIVVSSKTRSSSSSGGGGSSSSNALDERARLSAQYKAQGYNQAQADQLAIVQQQGNTRNVENLKQTFQKREVSSGSGRVFRTPAQVEQAVQQRGAKSFGTVQGRFYRQLTPQELAQNRLSPNTLAIEDVRRTQAARQTREAEERLNQARKEQRVGSSADLFTVTARGGKEANLFNTPKQAIKRADFQRSVINAARQQGIDIAKGTAKLIADNIARSKITPQKANLTLRGNFIYAVGKTEALWKKWADFIEKQERGLSDFEKAKIRRITGRNETRLNYINKINNSKLPDKLKSVLVKSLSNLSGTLAATEEIGSRYADPVSIAGGLGVVAEKAAFATSTIPLAGLEELKKKAQRSTLKQSKNQILEGLKQYYSKPQLDAFFGTYVNPNKKGIKRVRWDTIAEAAVFAFFGAMQTRIQKKGISEVDNFKGRSKAKVGALERNKAGDIAIVTKGGRRLKVNNALSKFALKFNEYAGRSKRAKKTEVARATQEVLRKPSKKANRIISEAKEKRATLEKEKVAKASERKITQEINSLARKGKMSLKEKSNFAKAYKRYRINPTEANYKRVAKISEQYVIRNAVRRLDAQIRRTLPRTKKVSSKSSDFGAKAREKSYYARFGTTKSAVKKYQNQILGSLKRAKVKISSSERAKILRLAEREKLGFRTAKKDLTSFIEKITERQNTANVKKSISKNDIAARKKGFADAKEQAQYERAFESYKTGNQLAGNILGRIEARIAKRKGALGRARSRQYKATRKRLVKEAIQLLRKGRLKIKDKKYKVIAKRKPLSAKATEALALNWANYERKQQRIQNIQLERQAKAVLNDVLEGKKVEVSPKLNSAIRRVLNKQLLQELRRQKAIQIEQGLIKGKQPKTALSKSARKNIIANAKKQEVQVFEKFDALKEARDLTNKNEYLQLASNGKIEVYTIKPVGNNFVKAINRRKSAEINARIIKNLNKRIAEGKPIENIPKYFRRAVNTRASSKSLRKSARKNIIAKIEQQKNLLRRFERADPEITAKYQLEITSSGEVLLKPKQVLSGKKIQTARQLIRKTNTANKGVEVKKADGTIQVLKAETQKAPQLRKLQVDEIRSLWQRFKKKQKARTPKTRVKQIAKNRQRVVVKLKQRIKSVPKTKLASAISIFPLLSQVLAQSSRVRQATKQALKSDTIQDTKVALIQERAQDSLQDLRLIQGKVQELGLLQDQKLRIRQDLRLLQDLILKLKTRIKRRVPIKPKIPLPLPKIKIPNWDDVLPKGYTRLVKVQIRVRGKNKILPKKMTPNRALRFIASKVDNTTARSFNLVTVGITKQKDIKRPKNLRKFRPKKSRGSPVLPFVEKSTYAIDTVGEKRGLRLSKVLNPSKKRKPQARRKKRKASKSYRRRK